MIVLIFSISHIPTFKNINVSINIIDLNKIKVRSLNLLILIKLLKIILNGLQTKGHKRINTLIRLELIT